MTKLNCWEHKQCGRQPGGYKVQELGVCPVATASNYHGLNKGKHGGRLCWAIAGSLCNGEVQGMHARKFKNCVQCDFFLQVSDEESHEFQMMNNDNKKIAYGVEIPDSGNSKTLQVGNEQILLVDDDRSVTSLFKRALSRQGYWITASNDSREAFNIFSDTPGRFDLIITDYNMPGLNGEQLSSMALDIRQDIPIILCTGFSQEFTEEMAQEIGIKRYCTKPLCIKELSKHVREVLDEDG